MLNLWLPPKKQEWLWTVNFSSNITRVHYPASETPSASSSLGHDPSSPWSPFPLKLQQGPEICHHFTILIALGTLDTTCIGFFTMAVQRPTIEKTAIRLITINSLVVQLEGPVGSSPQEPIQKAERATAGISRYSTLWTTVGRGAIPTNNGNTLSMSWLWRNPGILWSIGSGSCTDTRWAIGTSLQWNVANLFTQQTTQDSNNKSDFALDKTSEWTTKFTSRKRWTRWHRSYKHSSWNLTTVLLYVGIRSYSNWLF